MNEETWLQDLARRAAEREGGLPAPWQALVDGTLPAVEEERLRARAGESEQVRDGLELFRPLGSHFHDRMVAEMRSRVGPRPTDEPSAKDATRVIAFPRTSSRGRPSRLLAVAAAVGMVALGLLWLLPPGEGTPLPAYEIELRGISYERSVEETSEAATLAPNSTFQIDLKPREAAGERVGVELFVTRDAQWRVWPVPEDALRVAPSGAVRLEDRMTGDLVLESGLWTLVAIVGRPSDLPSSEEARACFVAGEGCADGGGWRMVRKVFRVAADG